LILTCAQAIEDALARRGLGDVWWGARVLDAWPYVVGRRYAEAARPFLEKSPLEERGLLTVAVRSSAWVQELSFLSLAERLNHQLGRTLVRTVRFEVREVLP
jgi:formylmethanofuran dehydrogenase subunit B